MISLVCIPVESMGAINDSLKRFYCRVSILRSLKKNETLVRIRDQVHVCNICNVWMTIGKCTSHIEVSSKHKLFWFCSTLLNSDNNDSVKLSFAHSKIYDL